MIISIVDSTTGDTVNDSFYIHAHLTLLLPGRGGFGGRQEGHVDRCAETTRPGFAGRRRRRVHVVPFAGGDGGEESGGLLLFLQSLHNLLEFRHYATLHGVQHSAVRGCLKRKCPDFWSGFVQRCGSGPLSNPEIYTDNRSGSTISDPDLDLIPKIFKPFSYHELNQIVIRHFKGTNQEKFTLMCKIRDQNAERRRVFVNRQRRPFTTVGTGTWILRISENNANLQASCP